MDFAYIIWMLLGTAQFIGSCIYISAMCEHFDSIMQKVQANIKQNRGEKKSTKIQCNSSENLYKNSRSGWNSWRDLWVCECCILFSLELFGANAICSWILSKSSSIFSRVSDINSVPIAALLPASAMVIGITMYQLHQVSLDWNA